MRTLFVLSLFALVTGCASQAANTTTTSAAVDPSAWSPPSSDGYVFVEHPAAEPAPKAAPRPMHMETPNHEAPTEKVHAAVY